MEVKIKKQDEIFLSDESFDAKSDALHLAVITGGKEFSAAVLDKKRNKYLVLLSASGYDSFLEKMKSVGLSSPASVRFCMTGNRYALVPSALYDEESSIAFFSFSHELNAGDELFHVSLHNPDAKIIFSVPSALVSSIKSDFPNAHFTHSASVFVESLFTYYKNEPSEKMFANFSKGLLELVVIKGKELLFCNSFCPKTAEESAYYALFVYEQLNLSPEIVPLYLSGEIETHSEEHSLLYSYVRNVKFSARPEAFQYSYKFDEIPAHKYFSLFASG